MRSQVFIRVDREIRAEERRTKIISGKLQFDHCIPGADKFENVPPTLNNDI